MTRLILHYEGSFLEWSQALAAPVTTGMQKDEIISYLCKEGHAREDVIKTIKRAVVESAAALDGSSDPQGQDIHDILSTNRAGAKGSHLDPQQIMEELFKRRESLF